MSDDSRRRLSAAQEQILECLFDSAQCPAGFDESAVQQTADSLTRKRARALAGAWPLLVASLKDRFDADFMAYAYTHSSPPESGPLVDGKNFANFLDTRGSLPDEGRIERMYFDLRYRIRNGVLQRRTFGAHILFAKRKSALIIGVNIPLVDVMRFKIDIPSRHT